MFVDDFIMTQEVLFRQLQRILSQLFQLFIMRDILRIKQEQEIAHLTKEFIPMRECYLQLSKPILSHPLIPIDKSNISDWFKHLITK